MNIQKKIAELQKRLAKLKDRQAAEQGKAYLALAKKHGAKSIDEFIKALAAFASPVLKGKLGASKTAPKAAKPAAPAKKKRTRAVIDDKKREAITADLRAGKMTGSQVAAKHGVSVPSVANIKKAAGLVKK